MNDTSLGDDAPLVSVVIPTHNVRPWLRQTLECVLRQDVALEAIVVDDRSHDGTVEAAEGFAQRDARVRVTASPSPGGGSARNAGAALARGRYLIFADGDDLIPDGAYRALVDSLERSGSDMAVGDYIKFRAVDTWRPTENMPAFRRAVQGSTLAEEPTLLHSRPCWNRAFRLDFWRRAGIAFPDVPRSNDIVPMVRAMLSAVRIDVVAECVYVYRERPGGGSMTARAGAAESLVSYLRQEAECAALVAEVGGGGADRTDQNGEAAVGAEAVNAAYADLVWDRDGFVAVSTYLRGWNGDAAGDADVARAVRELIEAAPGPTDLAGPLRVLTLQLVADGEFAAAHVIARAIEGALVDGAQLGVAIEGWRRLAELLGERDPLEADKRDFLAAAAARHLALAAAGAVVRFGGAEDGAVLDTADVKALAGALGEVLGARATAFVPDRIADGIDARVSGITGGDVLLVSGTVPDAVHGSPVLLGGDEPIAAASVTWQDEGIAGRRAWSAVFPRVRVSLGGAVIPGFATADGAAPVIGDAHIAGYHPRDRFLFDASDGVTVIRRRRHWAVRAASRVSGAIVRRLSPAP